jgi:hypothetical protein
MNNGKPPVSRAAVEDLIETATVLSEDQGDLVAEAVRAAGEHPLDDERAARLYTKILTILNEHTADNLTDDERAAVAARIRHQVEDIVASVKRPTSEQTGGLTFVEHEGLTPREVLPRQTFNGKFVPMTEGYVDVETLKLWKGNHRLTLVVSEFEARNGRSPSADELVELMQGTIHLPSLEKSDPFKLKPLADSIARKGVEVPPIVTYDGEPKDGNRRIAASLLVLHDKDYAADQKQRARYIRVWQAPEGTTDDQFNAIVVSRNFESDYKEPWPEFIKGRMVVDEYELRKEQIRGRITASVVKQIRADVAKDFAIKPAQVDRYAKMVYWADDFAAYHKDQGEDPSKVDYKTEKNFQWFIELDAGRGNEKLTRQLDNDDELKAVVYDLMFNVLDSGEQVRDLRRVVADAETAGMLLKAHEMAPRNPTDALDMVEDAITEAKRRNIRRRSIGFEDFLKTMVDRLGTTPPDQWKNVDTELLLEVQRIMTSTLGSLEGQVVVRKAHGENVEA